MWYRINYSLYVLFTWHRYSPNGKPLVTSTMYLTNCERSIYIRIAQFFKVLTGKEPSFWEVQDWTNSDHISGIPNTMDHRKLTSRALFFHCNWACHISPWNASRIKNVAPLSPRLQKIAQKTQSVSKKHKFYTFLCLPWVGHQYCWKG